MHILQTVLLFARSGTLITFTMQYVKSQMLNHYLVIHIADLNVSGDKTYLSRWVFRQGRKAIKFHQWIHKRQRRGGFAFFRSNHVEIYQTSWVKTLRGSLCTTALVWGIGEIPRIDGKPASGGTISPVIHQFCTRYFTNFVSKFEKEFHWWSSETFAPIFHKLTC